MTEKEFNKLKPGDKVRIVSERVDGMNMSGEMDKWLGKVMTVRGRWNEYSIQMEEDKNENIGGWLWGRNMIRHKVSLRNTLIDVIVRGNKTIAKRDNGKVGIAKCDPKDEFDEAKGAIIAVARAYGWQYADDDTDNLTLTKLNKRIKKSTQVKKRYELLPWDEAKKAVAGTEYDCDFTIYGISKVTWENIRRENEATASDQYSDEDKERHKRNKLARIDDALGFSWLIPECCIVYKYGDAPSDAAIDKLAEGVFGKPLKETAKDRVKRELKELSERRNSLSRALQGASKKLPESMKVEDEAFNLLEMQLRVMEMYEAILTRRLAIWKD